jgi:hypothetical protein
VHPGYKENDWSIYKEESALYRLCLEVDLHLLADRQEEAKPRQHPIEPFSYVLPFSLFLFVFLAK